MEKKFLVIYAGGNPPQYITVLDEDMDAILEQFNQENVLHVTDRKDGNDWLFNMANVNFMVVQPWREQNRG